LKTLEEEIANIDRKILLLLDEEPIMWDEINTLERELLHLKKMSDLTSAATATEDAALAMMESIAKKGK
jgi:hypothetical protein